MRMLLCLGVLTSLTVLARADEPKMISTENASWSGFTADQIADHLGLQGGNISFEFEDPVYLDIEAVWMKEGSITTQNVLNSESPNTQFDIFIKIEDTSPGAKLPDSVKGHVFIRYRKAETDRESGISSGGVGMNYYWDTNGGRTQREYAWNRPGMEFFTGEKTPILSVADANDPELNFYKLYIRFSQEPTESPTNRER